MRHRPVWLFDLDNTLHDAEPHIFPHLHRAMSAYMQTHLGMDAVQADAARQRYWLRYGATLLGLMRHHGVAPAHFLALTHRDAAQPQHLVFERALRHRLRRLPGRKIVVTNAPRRYAEAVLSQLGITHLIDRVFAIEDMDFHPKPDPRALRRLLMQERLRAHRCILVEDSLSNLRTARRLGMSTVWIHRGLGRPPEVDLMLRSVLNLRLPPARRGRAAPTRH